MTADQSESAASTATAAEILRAVGGAANVVGLTRCWSRLRFVLVDRDLADLEALGSLRTVAVVAVQQGEVQVALSRRLAETFDAAVVLLRSSAGG